MLIFLMIGPLPPVFAASTITGSTASEGTEGKGTVTVSGARPGAQLILSPSEGGSSMNGTASPTGTFTFTGVEPGIYTVQETAADGTTSTSNIARVIPSAVQVASPDQAGRILVSGAKSDAVLTMRHDRIGFFSPPTRANQDGIGTFNVGYNQEQVSPGKNYRVVQTINGVTSAESNSIDIAPERVRLNVTIAGAGINNNGGAILVSDTRQGNRLFLYKVASGAEPIIRTVEAENTYTFTGLSAGEYYVIQEEHGAAGPESNYVKIIDEMAPTIELVGPATDKVSMPKNYENWEYPVSISDVIAKDNISIPIVEYTVSPDRKINTPGVYKITYTARDEAGNASTVTKTVTITPPTLDIDENKIIHTSIPGEPKPGRNTGDIFVNNVMAEATIKVYQDPGGQSIKTITRANDATFGEFKVTDIPVGKTYYITQTVNGIESETSIRVDIRDTTKPTIELIGDAEVQFIRGDTYIEYGAFATDNVDSPGELSAKIRINSNNVDMNVPGIYTVTYDVTDNAGNAAEQVTRKVTISPQAPIAIGSYADLGEVSVKNAYPGTILKLFNVKDTTTPVAVTPTKLAVDMTTYVFKHPTTIDGIVTDMNAKIPPGSYYVVQEFEVPNQTEPLRSARSNIADVIDTNRPYITINGSENVFHVWDETKGDYTYNNSYGQYEDPGATATDYLDDNEVLTGKIKRKMMFGNTLICDENILDNPPCNPKLDIEVPGVYTIYYNVTTIRGAEADEKQRTVTVAPPTVGKLTAEPGESTIIVDEVFHSSKAKTVVHLYNAYGKLIKSQDPDTDGTATFDNILAGLGYYVTQTVNGIESRPSASVNVTLFEDAKDIARMAAFEFPAYKAVGVIDDNAGTVHVTVPKGTDIANLKAKFTATGTVKVGNEIQINGNGHHTNFSNDVIYTVASKDDKEFKDYVVKVTAASLEVNTWKEAINKPTTFSSTGSIIALSAAEKEQAKKKGVSFVGVDRAVHVPPSNVIEANTPTLSIKTPLVLDTRESDPTWSQNIVQPTEIGWSNSAQPFMRPIEIELSKHASGQSFAKIVREGNQLLAITQLSEKQGDNIIGLATEPGTYALVDSIAKPNITPTTSSGKTTYTITTTVPNAQIYYTTNSSHIAFDQSARRAELKSYALDGVPDFSKWETYRAGEQIAAPSSGELYAFVMKDQIISPLAEAITITPTEWRKNIPTYTTSHVLKVNFNTRVERKALYAGMIKVVDDATGSEVATTLSLSTDGRTILIAPDFAYKRGNQYTLHIAREFKGNTKDKQFLKQPLTQTFVTK